MIENHLQRDFPSSMCCYVISDGLLRLILLQLSLRYTPPSLSLSLSPRPPFTHLSVCRAEKFESSFDDVLGPVDANNVIAK